MKNTIQQLKKAAVMGAALTLASVAASTHAEDFDNAFSLSTEGGFQNPLVIVGFNPQPEPPAGKLSELVLSNPQTAQIRSSLDPLTEPGDPLLATIALGIGFEDFVPIGSDFESAKFDGNEISFNLFADGNRATHLITLALGSSNGGITGVFDSVAFNPQPEPPALAVLNSHLFGIDAVIELPTTDLLFGGIATEPFLTLDLSISDLVNGGMLSFSSNDVPEPQPFMIMMLGALCLLAHRKIMQPTHADDRQGLKTTEAPQRTALYLPVF